MQTKSPESAKIDFLNLELNAAKTRVVQLETTVVDQVITIKIQNKTPRTESTKFSK